MNPEKLVNRPLEEDELACKLNYIKSGPALWEVPMSFSTYERYLEDGTIPPTPKSDLFKVHSKNKLGSTVDDIDTSYNVAVTVHRRYSYPVLHNHEYVEIIYVAKGECENLFSGSSFHMKEGDVCIMSPNAYHALSCTNDESCILNIMVSKKFFNQNSLDILSGHKLIYDFFENILYRRASSPYILFPTGQDPWLYDIAAHMLSEAKNKRRAYDYSLRLLAGSFLLHVTRDYELMAVVPNNKSDTPNDLIVSILGYIYANYNHVTLEETAKFFGYSTAYLSRSIHKNIGKTFNTIVTEIQMEHALSLLKEGKLNLSGIAQEVGCFDSSHFNRKFKSVYGIAPRRYTEEIKKDGAALP